MNKWQESFSTTPLAIGTARGLRCWFIDPPGYPRLFLYPQNGHMRGAFGVTWESTELKAECRHHANAAGISGRCKCSNPVPCRRCDENNTCGCGIWAYWDIRGVMEYAAPTSETVIAGVVEATGRTILGPRGFRTAHAKILGLTMLRHGMDPAGNWNPIPLLEEQYNVPIFESLGKLTAEYPPTPEAYNPKAGAT